MTHWMVKKSGASRVPRNPQSVLTILGCGTSGGVPFIGCRCQVCRSRNPKNKRTRSSAWIQTRGKSLIIDTGPDFRLQALREKILRVDAVLYTHPHADHIHGIDELRSFNYLQKEAIPLYGNAWLCDELKSKFSYIFRPGPVEGGGIPVLNLNRLEPETDQLKIKGVPVIPIPHEHGSRQSLGYRIDSVAYIADCSYIPPSSIDRLQGLSALVLDCVRLNPHRTHLNLDRALEVVNQVKPKKAYFIHLGHDFDYVKYRKILPRGAALAYDGLKIAF